MTIACGIFKRLTYQKESTFGVAPSPGVGQRMRRTSSTLSLNKDSFASQEIRTSQQVVDLRHGVHRVGGGINGELSLGTWADFLAAAVRKDWTAGPSGSQADFVGITASAATRTFTVTSGSFLGKGFKIGDVVRFTGLGNVSNVSKNFRVTNLSATTMTVAEAVGDDAGPNTTFTVAVPGKKVWVPATAHNNDSFSIEHYFSDLDETELFLGCRLSSLKLSLPATGLATVGTTFIGQDMVTYSGASSPYFTSPTAESHGGALASVNGTLRVGNADVATVTSLEINIAADLTSTSAVGSNMLASIVPGLVKVTGQMSVLFDGTTLRNHFLDEDELSLMVTLAAAGAAPRETLAIVLPRVKLTSASKDDNAKSVLQTVQFQALENTADGTGLPTEHTTIMGILTNISASMLEMALTAPACICS
ncbi:MAG: phage tail tube protein, partial [Alphaproteobacteria bacterium]